MPIAPELFVRGGRAAVEFYAAAFGAVVDHQVGDGDAIVAQLSVGDATFWVHDEAPEHGNLSPQSLGGCTVRPLLIVDDPDTVFATALAAGAEQISPVGDEHGWRVGRLRDPFGHHWEIGRPTVPWPPIALRVWRVKPLHRCISRQPPSTTGRHGCCSSAGPVD